MLRLATASYQLVNWEGRARKTLLVFCVLGFGVRLTIAAVRGLPTVAKDNGMVLAFGVAAVYFISLSGFTFWTGSRILYPAEFFLVAVAAMHCQTFGTWITQKLVKRST